MQNFLLYGFDFSLIVFRARKVSWIREQSVAFLESSEVLRRGA